MSKPSAALRDPPWDLVLAVTVMWAIVTGPIFFASLFVIYMAQLSSIDDELRLNLVLAVPITAGLGAIGALTAGVLRKRFILTVTSTLPFLVLVVAVIALATKFF